MPAQSSVSASIITHAQKAVGDYSIDLPERLFVSTVHQRKMGASSDRTKTLLDYLVLGTFLSLSSSSLMLFPSHTAKSRTTHFAFLSFWLALWIERRRFEAHIVEWSFSRIKDRC